MTLGPVRVMEPGVVVTPCVKEVKFILTIIKCVCALIIKLNIIRLIFMHILVNYTVCVCVHILL